MRGRARNRPQDALTSPKLTTRVPRMTIEIGDRLTELKARKAAKALTAAERLELQELTLKQKRLKLAREEAAHAQAKRKLDNQLRYKLGGLAVAAGVENWDEATLRGALLSIARTTDRDLLEQWRLDGGRAYNADIQARKRSTVALIVRFPTVPPENVRIGLKGKGLAWDDQRQVWHGPGVIQEIEEIAVGGGGTVQAAP